MKPLVQTGLFAALLLASPQAFAGPTYRCGVGVVRDVQSVRESVSPVHVEHCAARDTSIEPAGDDHSEASTAYHVTVQFGQTLFITSSSGDEPWNIHPTQLRSHEVVDVCTNGIDLVLERSDAKDYRARIIRIEPAPKANRSSSARH
jgi:hypothetical protein